MGVPIERHAETIYTRDIHERFYNELYESGAYTIADKSLNGQRYTVVHTNEIGCEQARQYDVILTGMEKVQCSCGLYEHVGLPCRHSLKVRCTRHLYYAVYFPPGDFTPMLVSQQEEMET